MTNKNLPVLIGIGGALRSGKDTVADYYVDSYEFKKVFMSEPLNEAALKLDPWILLDKSIYITGEDETYRWGEEGSWVKYSTLIQVVGYTEAKVQAEVRKFLQMLGTEVGRQMIGENTWVDIAAKKITELREAGHPVVITGIRYPNEIEMVKNLGGHTVWIERPEPKEDDEPGWIEESNDKLILEIENGF